jgi:hypothetical protein
MKEISYYELLKMIKDGNIPKKVNYKITGYLENYVEYTAQYDRNDFTHYELTNHHREDENIHFYLNENYLESDMFEESILILEEEKKIPEKLPIYDCIDAYSKFDINDNRKAINEIIDYLKSKGE